MSQRSERAPHIVGDLVSDWFADRAMIVRSSVGPGSRVVADSLPSNTVSLLRLWHTPLDVMSSSVRRRDDAVRLVLMLDGELQLRLDDRHCALGKYECVLFPSSSNFSMTTDTSSARIEIDFNSVFMLHTHGEKALEMNRVHSPSASSEFLAGLINLAFSSGVSPVDKAWAHLARIVAEACTAALTSDSRLVSSPTASSAEVRIFRRAMDLIENRSVRAAFSVGQLAQEVGASPSVLRNAFAAHGLTARDAIRDSRSARARPLLDTNNFTSRQDLERVAAVAGFSSIRAMRDALKREEERASD